jgi:hypothetical protein
MRDSGSYLLDGDAKKAQQISHFFREAKKFPWKPGTLLHHEFCFLPR